jgi:calcineurin-like phosphoesterase family protein
MINHTEFKETDPLFFIADTHLNHSNIIKYTNRPFKNSKEMDECIINNWNQVVPKDGYVFHLGDFSFGYVKRYYEALNGTIFFIKGNHDKEKDIVYTTAFDGVDVYKKIRVDKQEIILFHYPIYSWDKKLHGSWHLYGHVHDKTLGVDIGINAVNVSVEQTNYKPISFEQLKLLIKLRSENAV